MIQGDLRYYNRYAAQAPMVSLRRSIFARPRTRKQVLLNRMRDYRRLQGNGELLQLHRSITLSLLDGELSFANHSTYAGKTAQSIHQDFGKCWPDSKADGLLVFESHHPDFEGDSLENACSVIAG